MLNYLMSAHESTRLEFALVSPRSNSIYRQSTISGKYKWNEYLFIFKNKAHWNGEGMSISMIVVLIFMDHTTWYWFSVFY